MINSNNQFCGLTSEEAENLLLQHGRNFIPEKVPNRLVILLRKFWAPVPWLLELTIVLQLLIGKFHEAVIIAVLLVFNSLLSFFQEERANKALILLKENLAIKARVLRDNLWQSVSADALVPSDIIYLRMGDIVPADVLILKGQALLDQSTLTGEALPIETVLKETAYSGTIVKRGEFTGEVLKTGKNTYFGKTVELVQTSVTKSHIKNIIFTIVKYLVGVDGVLAVLVLGYAVFTNIPLVDVIPFILILLVASVPVALAATFTLATALGAHKLAKLGVLVTRLSAIEEAAVMDIICLDKTGTITRNKLELAELRSYAPYKQEELLQLALIASDEATLDPIDFALFKAARAKNIILPVEEKLSFIPFDPIKKSTEATFKKDGKVFHVIKGAPDFIADMLKEEERGFLEDASRLAANGYRVLAVAIKNTIDQNYKLVGFLALNDPPRTDSKALINDLQDLGLRIQMVTGDGLTTAQSIAEQVGIGTHTCLQKELQQNINNPNENIYNCDVFAGFFPEDKFNLVQVL